MTQDERKAQVENQLKTLMLRNGYHFHKRGEVERFAREKGIQPSTIARILRGINKGPPSNATLDKIARSVGDTRLNAFPESDDYKMTVQETQLVSTEQWIRDQPGLSEQERNWLRAVEHFKALGPDGWIKLFRFAQSLSPFRRRPPKYPTHPPVPPHK